MSDSGNNFSEIPDDANIDDLLAVLSDAVDNNARQDRGINEIVNSIVDKAGDEVLMLGNFVMSAEIIDSEGGSSVLVVTSDNIPEWIARGLILVAEDYLTGFM